MLFNSVEFLIFFPTVVLLYYFFPHKLRWFLLLIASCIFYMAFIPRFILILFFLILVDYFAGIYIERSKGKKRKVLLIISLLSNIGILSLFKYFNFFSQNLNLALNFLSLQQFIPSLNLILPLGLSFHVFQSMSYTIEIYTRKKKAEKHLGIYALYVMFFPQLVAGPIERAKNLLPQFHKKHTFNSGMATSGLQLILWGFFKKVVIADRLGLFVDSVYSSPSGFPAPILILATYAFAYQIYCDFSGYSDIAIGSARVLGFKLMTNFSNPYSSTSIPEFWKKWHISLSSWFRDYVYIPLGGNRVNAWKWCRNILIVFMISGLWHGADWKYVLWGTLHGIFILMTLGFGKYLNPHIKINSTLKNLLGVIVTFNLTSFAWIFFRAKNVSEALVIINKILTPVFAFDYSILRTNGILTTLIFILILEILQYLQKDKPIWELFTNKPRILRWSAYYAALFIIIFYGEFHKAKFIYFQF